MKKTVLTVILAGALSVASGPVFGGSAAPAGLERPAAATAAPVEGQQAPDPARYAARERQAAPETKEFRGGDGMSIYVGGSALVIAAAILVLLLLL